MTQDAKYWETRPLDDPHKDWKIDGSWLEGYEKSIDHPHRKLILRHLKEMESLLELGCNVGPNLLNINKKFPKMKLFGVDANPHAAQRCQDLLPEAKILTGDLTNTSFDDYNIDVVLADAVLMYIPPTDIVKVMADICWLANEKVIIVDRFANSRLGVNNGYIWYRNYTQLLQEHGFKVSKTKITKDLWPHSNGWSTAGYMFVGQRP